ncbi:MAG: hypothetical protein R2939_12700 [Kofleriaceae bacterium]
MTSSRVTTGLVFFLGATTLASVGACGKDQLSGPKAEVQANTDKVDLPDVPDESDFAFPKHEGGAHSVKELRVRREQFLDQKLTVRGFVVETYTWVKDCAPTIEREPKWTDADVIKAIEADPTKCQLIKFYLGDSKDTPVSQALWVVDAPRAPTPLEKERLPKEEIADPRMWKEVIPYEVGDEVTVTGTFAIASPHSERNLKGLLVYETMKNITQGVESQPLPPEGEPPPARPPGGR